MMAYPWQSLISCCKIKYLDLLLVLLEADAEIRIWVHVVYLGVGHRTYQQGMGE